MKYLPLIFSFFLLFSPASASAESASIPLNLTYITEELPPYNFNKNGQPSGISVEVLEMIWRELGIPQQPIQFQPWGRAYDTALHQPGTVIFTTIQTASRAPLFKWVGPIVDFNISLMTMKNRKIRIMSNEDLVSLHIGAVNGYASADILKEIGVERRELHPNLRLHIRKLVNGRIDALSIEKCCFWRTINEMGLNPELFESAWSMKSYTAGFAFNNTTPDAIIEQFQNALNKVKQSPAYQDILKRYLP